MGTPRALRFPIRFDPWYAWLSRALLLPPSDSYIEIEGDGVRVRMGWAFRAGFSRRAVARAEPCEGRPLSRGVHGLAGRWLVNGSGRGLVKIDFEPKQRGYVLGYPVALKELFVSLQDPAGAMRALNA